jgi:hypothetical protein
MKRNTRSVWVVIGFSLILISLLLFITSFDRDSFWSGPWVFITFSILGAPFAMFGSFYVSRNLIMQKRANGWLNAFGRAVFAFSIVGWIITVMGAIFAFETRGVSNYNGDYFGYQVHVWIFQLTIILAWIGGLLLGLGLPERKKKEIDEQG